MSDYTWIVELAVKSGQKETFAALRQDMLSAIRTGEPGTLNYEFFGSDDGSRFHIYERYVDGAAFKTHLANFEKLFSERFGAAVEVSAFTVYGDPDAETRELLAGFGAVIMLPAGRMVR